MKTISMTIGKESSPANIHLDATTGSFMMEYADASAHVIAYPSPTELEEMIAMLSAHRRKLLDLGWEN